MDDQFRNYVPKHEVTPNYLAGMTAVREGRLSDALVIFSKELVDSPCFGLALANSALSLFRLNRYTEAEEMAIRSDQAMQLWCPHPPTNVQTLRTLAEAVAAQGRLAESNDYFHKACVVADALCKNHVEFKKPILLEKAHAINSWGGAHLQASRHTKNYDVAIELFNKARDIYKQYGGTNPIGLAEVLTNCGQAYRLSKEIAKAEYSYIEALEASKTEDQRLRVQLALIQIASEAIKNPKEILTRAAAYCESGGRFGTAYVRYAIGASWALDNNETIFGLECIAKARVLEEKIDERDPYRADLRMTEAQLLLQANPQSTELSHILIEGARLWYSRLERNLISDDLSITSSSLHEHFRFLARTLLDNGRIEEALVGFECGKSLDYCIETNPTIQSKLISKNPFPKDGNKINCDFIKEVQKNLKTDEVILLITIIPPELVAFIITSESIRTITQKLPNDGAELQKFNDDLKSIPSRLRERVGIRAIPDILQTFAANINIALNTKKIISLVPYSQLHSVPWRILLKEVGADWSQLTFTTEFTLIPRFFSGVKNLQLLENCFALGNGFAEKVDLNEEAKQFANAYSPQSVFIPDCSAQDVKHALSQRVTVLISCHGVVNGGKLMLTLNNRNFPTVDLFPDRVVSPIVILSACHSGVYEMRWSDYPEGAAPDLLRLGAEVCVATRYQVNAHYAKKFVTTFCSYIKSSTNPGIAFSDTLKAMESDSADRWRDLACFEILSRL